MIEIPESSTISSQAEPIMAGKQIAKFIQATSLHKFVL